MTDITHPKQQSFRQRYGRGFALGVVGILPLPFLAELPEGVPVAAVLINPLILLGLAALAGAWAAPKVGFQSWLIMGNTQPWRTLAAWFAAGLGLGLAVAFADHALGPLWQTSGVSTLRQERSLADVVLGSLYGGLTEEVLFRWGLMSLLTVGLLRVLSPGRARWTATVLAAVAFAAAHLPGVALEAGSLTTALVVRTLVWNALLGFVFCAAYLRSCLEAAILVHVAVHLGFGIAALPLVP